MVVLDPARKGIEEEAFVPSRACVLRGCSRDVTPLPWRATWRRTRRGWTVDTSVLTTCFQTAHLEMLAVLSPAQAPTVERGNLGGASFDG